MLYRPDLYEMLEADEGDVVRTHYIRAVNIRLHFRAIQTPWAEKGTLLIPDCHSVARAYAQAFGVEFVDGECFYIKGRTHTGWRKRTLIDLSSCSHSWNIVRVTDDISMILDMYPDENCPMMPVLLRNPHPAYGVPTDREFKRKTIDVLAADQRLPVVVDLLVGEFKRIEQMLNEADEPSL